MNALFLGLLQTPAADLVGSGKVTGGWTYIWIAYALTWASIAAYALSLWVRWPSRQQERS